MSTDVVLATHSDGVLRCYHRTADGALTQTAQIVAAAQIEPTALAAFVGDLSALFDWSEVSSPIAQNGSSALSHQAAPAITNGNGNGNGGTHTALLDLIREHPNETSWSLASMLLGPTATPNRRDAVRKRLDRMLQLGEVVRYKPSETGHYRYRIGDGTAPQPTVRPQVSEYRKRPRAPHTERARRRDAVLEYLQTHPNVTAMEVAAGVFAGVAEPIGKARSVLEQLGAQQLVVRTEHDDGPITFAAVTVPTEQPEQIG